MVCGDGIAGVTAVVGRDHEQIVLLHFPEDFGKALIKIGEGSGVAVNVVAVAVKHVIVNQVDKAEALKLFVHIGKGFLDDVFVSLGVGIFGKAFSCKNVVYFADADDIFAVVPELIQHIHGRRLY